MFSTYGDVVLDPFLGTGTTSLAAMVAGRDSIGYELDADLVAGLGERVERAPTLSRELAAERLGDQRAFAADNPGKATYEATHYDFDVVTKQERDVRLYAVDDVAEATDGYRATHVPVEE
jgi:site-specific DNA-methyltransferase (cytosine-N4-specific)